MRVFNATDTIKILEELLEKSARGETIKAAFRSYYADGTYRDIVLGAESEEEYQKALSSIDANIKTGTH